MNDINNPTRSAQRWFDYDKHTVMKDGPDGMQHVDHARSSVANLAAAGKNVLDAIDPTNHFRATWGDVYTGNSMLGSALKQGISVLMIPIDIARELLDLPMLPFRLTKNVGDAAVHGVLAGIEKVSGKS